MEQVKTLGERLTEAMRVKNTNAIALGEITGINPSLIYRYQKNLVSPKSDRIHILAAALQVNELWLMGYDVTHEIQTETSIELRSQIEQILNNLTTKKLNKVLTFLITFMSGEK